MVRFGTLDIASDGEDRPIVGAVFPRRVEGGGAPRRLCTAANSLLAEMGRNADSAPMESIHAAVEAYYPQVENMIPDILGLEPTQELLRDVIYWLSNVVVQVAGEEPLSVDEFMAMYARKFPDGQPWLDDVLAGRPCQAERDQRKRKLVRVHEGMDPTRECLMSLTLDGFVEIEEDMENSGDLSLEIPVEPHYDPTEYQIKARLRELSEIEVMAAQERDNLNAERGGRARARARARNVHRRLGCDGEADGPPPAYGRASQNLAAATLLLRRCRRQRTLRPGESRISSGTCWLKRPSSRPPVRRPTNASRRKSRPRPTVPLVPRCTVVSVRTVTCGTP